MFESKLASAAVLKKILDAIKDLLTEAQWECTETGMSLQAMDSSHVALVSLKLRSEGFEEYRCDRNLNMGINLVNMSKIMKCASNDDTVTLRAQEDGDTISFVFESPNQERQSEFEIKLMDLDIEHLGIPDTEYSCIVQMPSSEFSRICRDLSQLGDSMCITCTKSGIGFSSKGDLGSGMIRLSQSTSHEKEENHVVIDLYDPCNVTFAIKYLNIFAKASPLSGRVKISVSNDVPIVVEYQIEDIGFLRFYLAPKIDEDDVKKEKMDD
uniref:DNA sliding clamp PCNA n=1 Tax=Romanomermis culicivorax TaxID=13658 RepID=A0A915KNK1_ROMCU